MLSKNEIKYYSTLLQKKYRDKEGKFIVEGKRLVEEAITSKYKCEVIVVTQKFVDENDDLIKKISSSFRVEVIKEPELNKITDTQTPQGIAAVFSKVAGNPTIEPKTNLMLAMENISDPGNAGTIFRNADWFGVKQIVLSTDCADVFNPKVLRSSMGSIFHVEFQNSINFYKELDRLKESGYIIAVADMKGENLYNYVKPEKLVIVVCNEAHGPSKKLIEIADIKITIPRKGTAESLNVASASAVILNELTK